MYERRKAFFPILLCCFLFIHKMLVIDKGSSGMQKQEKEL